jgi:hypothetical protein
MFLSEFPFVGSLLDRSLYISVTLQLTEASLPGADSRGCVGISLSSQPLLSFLKTCSVKVLHVMTATSFSPTLAATACAGLAHLVENRIEGIYLSAEKAPGNSSDSPYVQTLPSARLDQLDFAVLDVIRVISPKITAEIVLQLLAQRSS